MCKPEFNREMPPLPQPQPPEHTRINLGDLKSQIVRKLGPERSQRYFGCLNKLLAQKLSKPEFNNFCLLTLGREFIPLHNQLILSILKNACHAKIPPLPTATHDKGASRHIGSAGKKSPQEDNELNPSLVSAQLPVVWSNGDILPPSLRKSRSSIRDRRIKDRPSPLGPNGRADVTPLQSLAASDVKAVRENGILNPCDLKRHVQHHQDGSAEKPAKRLRTENISTHDQVSVHRKGLVELATAEDEDELEQKNDSNTSMPPLRAPIGIPFCHASVGGALRSLTSASSSSTDSFSGSYDSGELCHTEVLRNRMQRIAEAQGLGGVTLDCANLLNNGLDAYLKRLINACVELAGARSGHEPMKQPVYRQQPHGKPMNGVLPGSHMHVQSSSRPLEGANERTSKCPISLQDFKVAMELNPQELGEDWPFLLEKICFRSFEE